MKLRMHLLSALLLLSLNCFAVTSFAASSTPRYPAPLTVRDDRGVELQFMQAPQRIVTLLPSLTETVCELGACDRLVGTDRYSNWPPSVQQLPKLGGLDDAQVERIYALKPDLIVAAKSARVLDRLQSLGLPVLALETQRLADVQHTAQLLAQVFGTPQAAQVLWSRLQTRVALAAQRIPPAWRGARVYFEVSSAPHAAGESSFIGELLAQLGLRNVVPAALGPFPKLNPEFVLRAQPDLIVASANQLTSMRQRPGWQHLRALKLGQHCGFAQMNYELLIRPGPRLVQAADELADCLATLPTRATTSASGAP